MLAQDVLTGEIYRMHMQACCGASLHNNGQHMLQERRKVGPRERPEQVPHRLVAQAEHRPEWGVSLAAPAIHTYTTKSFPNETETDGWALSTLVYDCNQALLLSITMCKAYRCI